MAGQTGHLPGGRRGGRPSGVVDIERALIWTYFDQMAHAMYGDGWHGPKAGLDSVLVVAQKAVLAVTVDSSPRPDCGLLHPDAERIHEAVCGLVGKWARLVIDHAQKATRPETYPRAFVAYEPRADEFGRRMTVQDSKRRVIGVQVFGAVWELAPGRAKPQRLAMSARDLADARAVYDDWLRALIVLAHHFTEGEGVGVLESFAVAPLPSARPAPRISRQRPLDRVQRS